MNQERAAIFNTTEKMFHENHLHKKGYDQELLNRFYQSMAVESMVAHDSYCCEYFPGSQPFPTPRQNNSFVGAPQHNPVQTINVPCPENCRPHNLTGALALADWTLC
ncbi:hypothetical protein DAPPUDRAFT_246005 [Daphnia pulex]|uniref:Uncharacterized protein n=1 Tax=Daphnia pulex TaxID=6669 RepID=E9GPG3_DAPPU|nr:hypothetical protein DAPPUDRAFT_246005 [Daphnia pulex]|eukprot:EFX78685.1 hypothetical protein DAPPUDRAFT_246005 [Daphnia pulex]